MTSTSPIFSLTPSQRNQVRKLSSEGCAIFVSRPASREGKLSPGISMDSGCDPQQNILRSLYFFSFFRSVTGHQGTNPIQYFKCPRKRHYIQGPYNARQKRDANTTFRQVNELQHPRPPVNTSVPCEVFVECFVVQNRLRGKPMN